MAESTHQSSYWEDKSFLQSDVLIIGAGIVGLSTAAELLERRPDLRVTIVERGLLPSGASTRNAGFACFGSLSEIIADIDAFGEDIALATLQARVTGLKRLQQRVPETAMDYQQHGGYELLTAAQMPLLAQLDRINQLLMPIFQAPVFRRVDAKINEFGFAHHRVNALLFNPFEAQLHSGMLMRWLLKHVQSLGALVLTGAEVQRFSAEQDGVHVELCSQSRHWTLRSEQLALCTNAFARTLLPELSVTPGRGQVLITEPIADLRWQGTFHAEEGYYYFRNVDQRILLGGARHQDFAGETTTEFGDNPIVSQALDTFLHQVISPKQKLKVAQHWSGIMAFGETKKPIVKRHDERTVIGVRMGGMGVAIGSSVAVELADLLLA